MKVGLCVSLFAHQPRTTHAHRHALRLCQPTLPAQPCPPAPPPPALPTCPKATGTPTSTASRHPSSKHGTPPERPRNAHEIPPERHQDAPIQKHCFLTFCGLLTSLWKKMEEIGNIWKITPIFAVKVRKGFRKRENLDGIPGGQAP